MAEPLEMLFGSVNFSGSRNHVVDGAWMPPWEEGLFRDIAWACHACL